MRRDYFICIFLLCIATSLTFTCFIPTYFQYELVIPRAFSIAEMILSWIFVVMVLLVIPIYSAVHKKFWFTAGLAVYGLFANLPEWILPGLSDKLQGDNASLIAVLQNMVCRFIYEVVKSPFAGVSPALGNNIALKLSSLILPSSLIFYAVVQIFRFYRDAYVADQLDPSRIMDSTAAENNSAAVASRRRVTREADVLGTVISAPVKNDGRKPNVRSGAPKTSENNSQVFPVNPGKQEIAGEAPKPKRIGPDGGTHRMPEVRKASVEPDTQVIHLGPPKSDN